MKARSDKGKAEFLYLGIALSAETDYFSRQVAAKAGEIFMAAADLTPAEEAQLNQTIEMFEVIVQSQPNDCQSLEILKEAYTKLEREQDVVRISKRIAEAYTEMGQLSSAILEY